MIVGTVWVNGGKGTDQKLLHSLHYFSHCYVIFMCNDKNLNMKQIIHFINAVIESTLGTKTTKQNINSRKY